MKEEFEKSRDTLILHLESKLDELRQQRNEVMNRPQSEKGRVEEKVYVSDYLKNQGRQSQAVVQNKKRAVVRPPSADIPKQIEVKSRAELVREKQEGQQRCQQLQVLFRKKRELQSIGIVENDANKIKSLYQNKDTRKKIEKELIIRKKNEEKQKEKERIIQQEMRKVESFLQESKHKSKVRNDSNEYSYKQLFERQEKKMKEYEDLLQKKLTLLEKERILELVFGFLKEFHGAATKTKVKQYLLANPELCSKFSITKAEIMRDLQVYQTKQKDFLNFTQFYQFVRAIEITSKELNPTSQVKSKSKAAPKSQKEQVVKTQSNIKASHDKQMKDYLRKLYVFMDSKRQKLVQRERMVLALKKCLLFDSNKSPNLSKESIATFGQIVNKTRQRPKPLQYYKKLDIKYIGLEELLNLLGQQQIAEQNPGIQEYQDDYDEFYEERSAQQQQHRKQQVKQQLHTVPEEEQINDFQKYGWGKQTNENDERFGQLKQIDTYYNEIADKYGNEIHWNGIDRYKQDFSKFNECIRQLNRQKAGEAIDLNAEFEKEEV